MVESSWQDAWLLPALRSHRANSGGKRKLHNEPECAAELSVKRILTSSSISRVSIKILSAVPINSPQLR